MTTPTKSPLKSARNFPTKDEVPLELEEFRGSILQYFTKIKLLGDGGSGKVYLVYAKRAKRLVALKAVSKRDMMRESRVPRALTEREILASVKHPFLVHYYGSFQTEHYCFYIMEFYVGGELFLFMHRQPERRFSEDVVRIYSAEVLLGLEYLHTLGIVFRDLKMENILVDGRGHLHITDFDLSKMLDPEDVDEQLKHKRRGILGFFRRGTKPRTDRMMSQVGTLEYMAPEVILGKGYKASVDWWTLGVLIYEMLFATTPFVRNEEGGRKVDKKATASSIVRSAAVIFPATPEVSPVAKDLMRNLLVRNPKERLGHRGGAQAIRAHPFFKGVDFDKLHLSDGPIVPPEPNINLPAVTPQETDEVFLGQMVHPSGEWAEFLNVRQNIAKPPPE